MAIQPVKANRVETVHGLPTRPPEECKVLVVDDDNRIVEIFSLLLQQDGYQVLTATDGYSAMNLINTELPDVAVLDVILPGIDGIELCKRIKETPSTRFLPVILVTGLNARSRRLDGLRAGADDFLEKPPDPLELTVRVRSLLRSKQLHDEVEHHRRELEERVEERTKELQLAYNRLQELGRVKDNVLGIVSHELATPLNQAKLALEIALQSDMPQGEQRVLLQQALDSFGLLEYRVRDIQAFTDPTELRLSPISLHDLINSAVEQVRNLRRVQQDAINLDLPTGTQPVMISPIPVTRAIAHLIQNAVKFGEGKPVDVIASTDDSHIHIRILDQGPGIEADVLPSLFKPLEQGDSSSTRQHDGLGIGLGLAKMIFDAHQIRLTVTSNPGKGTEAIISIPIANL